MPFRLTVTKADVQQALTDQGYTGARAANLDAAISSRASGAEYTPARAAKLDNLDAAVTTRAAPGAAMDLAAGAKTAIWNEAIPATPTAGSYGERLKVNVDATISSRPSGADWTAARAANLDAAISTRAAPGAAMDLAAGAKTAIWNEAIPATPTAGSYGERLKVNVDAAISSRPSGADWTAARAANLDAAISTRAAPGDILVNAANKIDGSRIDAAISSRAAPGAAMALTATAKTEIWNEQIPATPPVGTYGARLKDNLDTTISSRPSANDWTAMRASYLDASISSRASAVDYSAARAAKLDNLDAAISSRAAPGAAMDLAAGAKVAIWNEAIPATPTAGSYGERLKANVDAAISGRASPSDVDTQLGNRGITTGRMAKLDLVGDRVSNSGNVAAAGNSAGLTVSLDTAAAGQARTVVECRYSCGGAATIYAEGSDDNTTWYTGDTIAEGGVATDKLVGYLNTHRYFRLRSPTTGIDLTFEVRAVM